MILHRMALGGKRILHWKSALAYIREYYEVKFPSSLFRLSSHISFHFVFGILLPQILHLFFSYSIAPPGHGYQSRRIHVFGCCRPNNNRSRGGIVRNSVAIRYLLAKRGVVTSTQLQKLVKEVVFSNSRSETGLDLNPIQEQITPHYVAPQRSAADAPPLTLRF